MARTSCSPLASRVTHGRRTTDPAPSTAPCIKSVLGVSNRTPRLPEFASGKVPAVRSSGAKTSVRARSFRFGDSAREAANGEASRVQEDRNGQAPVGVNRRAQLAGDHSALIRTDTGVELMRLRQGIERHPAEKHKTYVSLSGACRIRAETRRPLGKDPRSATVRVPVYKTASLPTELYRRGLRAC